jgi:hypothetical protein
MELNSKKLERTSKIVYYSISGLLCLFLVLLSNILIGDLHGTTTEPMPADFENQEALSSLNKSLESQQLASEGLYSKVETIEKTLATARDNYANEKQSFDNWLQTRKTLGSPDKDVEVIARARRLDEYYKVEQEWREQLDSLQRQIDQINEGIAEDEQAIREEQMLANEKYYSEMKHYELRVFLIRLLFVAPVLALGVFFFVRYRRHKFWPLYFGFTLFSAYAFFFGLVPYLPSYGGYVRYSVGVLLSAGLGYYAIKRIREFIEQKREELKTSTQERARKVRSDIAEKALENHFCPSCGKDFILKKWEYSSSEPAEASLHRAVTSFCRHCGLELFKDCSTCGKKNFAHLPFCSSCGTRVIADA